MTAVASEVMWTVTRIAERDGVSRQAISKQVARLIEQHGLDVARDGRGRVSAVNIVHLDDLRRRFGDSGKVHAVPDRPASPEPDPTGGSDATIDGARRIKIIHETEMIRLRMAEDAGDLVRLDRINDATDRLVEELGRLVDMLQHADQIAAAFQRGGLHELRILLKRLTGETRTAIAESFAALARNAPAKDEGFALDKDEEA